MRGSTKKSIRTLLTTSTALALLISMSAGALAATTSTLPSSGGMLIGNNFYSFPYIAEYTNIVQTALNTAGTSHVILDIGGSMANLSSFIATGNISNAAFTSYASFHPATIPTGIMINDVQNGTSTTATYSASNLTISNYNVSPDTTVTVTGTLTSNGVPLANTTMSLATTHRGVVPTTVTTDANGNFSFVYTTSQTFGIVSDSVVFSINGYPISTNNINYMILGTIAVGSRPDALAYAAENGKIYVANDIDNTVSIISGSTNTVIATVSVGNNPYSIACDSTNGNVYVTNANDNTVSVIDGSTNAVVATVSVGNNPQSIAYDAANGDVYVANWNDSTVSVINGTTNTVVATVLVGSNPQNIAYDPNNGEIYVANLYAPGQVNGNGTISVINGSTNTVISTVPVGGNPQELAFDSANGELYVANLDDSTVSVINGATNAVVTTVLVGGTPHAMVYDAANGDMYVVNLLDNTVNVINTSSNTVIATVNVGPLPWFAAYDPENGDIYVTDSNSSGTGSVSEIDGSTNTLVNTVNVGSDPQVVAYDAGNGDIYVANTNFDTISVIPAFGSPTLDLATILQTLAIGTSDSVVQHNSNTNVSGLIAQSDANGITTNGVGTDSGNNAQLADVYVEPQNNAGTQGGAMNQSRTYSLAVSNGGEIYSINGVPISPLSALTLQYRLGTGYQVTGISMIIPSLTSTNPLWIVGGAQGALPEDFELGVINSHIGATTLTVSSGNTSSTAMITYNNGGDQQPNSSIVSQNSLTIPSLSTNFNNGFYSIVVSNAEPNATVTIYTSNGMIYATMTATSAGIATLNNVSSGTYYAIQTWNGEQSATSNWVST